MQLITRDDAAKKIRDHWLATSTREQLPRYEPNWARLRNYKVIGSYGTTEQTETLVKFARERRSSRRQFRTLSLRRGTPC